MTTGVAIALYNGSRFVEKQLETIRLQTVKPDRVVLCDDGSKDGTVEIVQNYITKHGLEDSWKLCINSSNLGYIRNFYKAVSLCDTDFVFLADQDDIWKEDKIEKMLAVMENRPDIQLLACKYGIIDAEDNQQYSFLEKNAKEDESVSPIGVMDIMRAYRWPGMIMCLRKTFFDDILPVIQDKKVAHDLIFTVCAADRNGFFSYNYVGAFHRRHDNNTAREEHRISKLLNLERKLADIEVTRKLWQNLRDAQLPLTKASARQIEERLELMQARQSALRNRKFWKIVTLYCADKGRYLRLFSFVCDLWLVCFGNYKEAEQG